MKVRLPQGAKNKILLAIASFVTVVVGILAKIEFIDDEPADPVEQVEQR